MDPKQDWRALAKVVPSDHFRFYSLSNPLFHPIKMNLLRIPAGVYTERYADKLREIFIRSYGLGDRAFQILGKAINEVYREAGCFDDDVKYNLKDPVTGLCPATERSKYITMEDVCKNYRQKLIHQSKKINKKLCNVFWTVWIHLILQIVLFIQFSVIEEKKVWVLITC